MSENEIKAAKAILKIGVFSGSTTFNEVFAQTIKEGLEIDDITSAAEYLETNKFITMIVSKNGGNQYRLTPMGNKFREDGKSIEDFITGEKQKELKVIEKEELDDTIKRLQKQDFEDKVHDLNPAQLSVLKGTDRRHYQTLMMVVIGVLGTALMAMLIKTCIR